MTTPVIDGNLLLGRCPYRQLPGDDGPDSLRQSIGAAQGIGTSFTALFYKDWYHGFLRDYEGSVSDSDLFHHVPVNPTLGGWRSDLEKALGLARTVSIKLAPFLHHYSLSAPFIPEIMSIAADKGLPVVLMRRLSDDRLIPRWLTADKLEIVDVVQFVERYQEQVSIVLSHFLPLEMEGVLNQGEAAPYCEVGTFTPSEGGYARLAAASAPDRLLFGSGAPFFYHGGSWLGLSGSELLPDLKQAIFCDNARRLYRLGTP